MTKRICPKCGVARFSADTVTTWKCDACGAEIPPSRELEIERKPESEIERAIEILTQMRFALGRGTAKISTTTALAFAIIALGEKLERENPKPLTIDELRKRDGKPVFAIDGEGHKCWVVVNAKDECCADNEFGSWHMYFYNMKNADSDTLHNMGWLAYDYELKEDKHG